ncbi:thymidylate synthase [Nonomuraea sp. NN258]|uniref:thymidylate synthase n=1 Tax=Nonomuraea antri TaxID=2730852 RepID=UPI00156A20CB|nr:thymidylate synthase [Nonomuraea antri]NRQ32977.1 thymidylate synthase [Nonomuraea antri]
MTPDRAETFHEAYIEVLRQVTTSPEYRISTRGNTSLELLDVSFRIADPTQRVPYLTSRPINLAYNWAEVLWYWSGRADLDMIGYYAPMMRAGSHDGSTLTGTAYGRSLFTPGPDGRTQWQRVLDLLGKDNDTKRAVLSIFSPAELAVDDNPDVSCTIAAQFFLREDRLHLTCYMRGNDAFMGLPSDVFSFTVLQELAAHQLGVQVGHYSHHVGSMHVNLPNRPKVRKILAEVGADGYQPPAFRFAAMPADACLTWLRLLAQEEAGLRTNAHQHTVASIAATGLAPYWQQVLLVWEAYRQISHTDQPVSTEILQALVPSYRWLVERRWPNRMPQVAA